MDWRIIMPVVTVCVCLMGSAHAAEYRVSQDGKVFSSTDMTLRPGDQIIFVNNDSVAHNVFSRSAGAKFETIQRPGESSTVSFQSEGVAEVRCVFHPKMKLTVQVKK